jgi:hypothetical protein
MSFFKDLTQKLVKSFFTNQNEDMSRHIVKSVFFANPEKRHLHYKHFVKSFFFANHEQKTCSVHTLCQIIFFLQMTNKDSCITNTFSNLFLQIAKEDMSITKTLSNLFFEIHEQRHVQYIHFVKSFFFVNHELKDMSITNLKTDQERKTLGMILSTIRNVERL